MRKANLILMAAMAGAGMTMATGALLAPAAAVAADAPKIGAKMSKPLRAAQEAINAKNWDEALAQLAEAAAIEPQTPYEAFMVDELGWFAMLQKKDYAGAEKTLSEAVASGFVPEVDLPQRYKALTQLNYQLKVYPKAVEYGNKVLALSPGSADIGMIVAHSLYMQDDFAGARDMVNKVVAGSATPDEQLLLIGLRSNYELKDRAGTMRSLELLIRHHAAQKYWVDLLNNQLYETKADRDLRALYRLMSETSTLDGGEEYSEMATTLMTGGFPTEARQTLERGIAAGVFQGDHLARAQSDLQRARSGADADRKELPGADAALAAAKTGNEMVAMGKLFFSVGDYAKAADAVRKGLAKGGVADTDDANLLLGIALARSGKAADATAAFSAVRDPKSAEVASLWKLYVDTTAAAAPASPPAPAG
jgi:tetratricopeptide (TPR) repeat protein